MPPRAEQRSIAACTFKKAAQLTPEQARTINELHETFANGLAQSLGPQVGIPFQVRLASAEPLTYGDFLERVTAITYMVAFRVTPMEVAVGVQLDISVVSPLIDVLLGGTGHCEILTRDITEIEGRVMESVAGIMCNELNRAWERFGSRFEVQARVPSAQVREFLAPTEKILCLSFEVKLGETQGMLNLVFPVAVATPFLRKLSSEGHPSAASRARRSQPPLRERMDRCPFPVALEVTDIRLSIQSLLELSPGVVRNLGVAVSASPSLLVGGRGVFHGVPVRNGKQRAVQVGEPILLEDEERRV